MKKRLVVLYLCAGVLISPAFSQTPPPMTVDQLVAKNVEAKGGAAALKALQSLKLTGRTLLNQGQFQLAVTQLKKRADMLRNEATLQGLTAVQAYDGKEGWRISPFQGRKDPEKLSGDDAKDLMEEAEIDGSLVDWKEKGSTVDYLGTEDVDGTPAYKLRVVRKNGDVNYVYLDADHFLEIRILGQAVRQGAQVEVETDLGDYEKVGGVFIPFSIESGAKGSNNKAQIIFDKGEANVPLDDSIFHFPAK